MRDLNSAISSNYRQHPAFNFEAASLELPIELLQRFNEVYAAVRKIAPTLEAKTLVGLYQDCEQGLDKIFQYLIAQTKEPFQLCFLEELLNASRKLITQELEWYCKPQYSGFVELATLSDRENIIRMHMQRHFFGKLNSVAVSEICEISKLAVDKFRFNVAAGRLTREDLSISSGPAVRAIRKVLNREFKKLGVLDVMSAYTGRKMRVVGLALELSVPQASWWKNAISGLDRPPQTLYAHLDETISCPKSIVYLTDVTTMNGPTGCYPQSYESMQLNPLQEVIGRVVGTIGDGAESVLKTYYAKTYHQSTSSENFRRHFMLLPECLRFNSHLGWDVMPGSELESELAENEQKMMGPAGTFIAFDGARLLHRGGLMQSGDRVALQVVFSDTSVLQQVVNRTKRMFV